METIGYSFVAKYIQRMGGNMRADSEEFFFGRHEVLDRGDQHIRRADIVLIHLGFNKVFDAVVE